MKVLHVGAKNYPPSHGGTERVVYDLVNNDKDIDSHILVEFEQEESINIKILPKGYLKKLKFILKYVEVNNIEVVHFHNETYVPLALLFSLRNKKNLVTIHGCHFTNPKYNLLQRFSILFFDIVGAALLPRLVFCNEVDKTKFSKWIPFRKIYFVPNGVKSPGTNRNIVVKESKDTIVYLGRISPEKNLHKLIKEADKANTFIHIYGAFDDRRPEFNTSINAALNQSKFAVWKGSVDYSEVFQTLAKYDTFIYPSISEGLPLSVLEAATCGLKLILSNIPQHKILNFPAVHYINPESFNLSLINFDKDGILNQKHVNDNFSIDRMIKGYKEIYNSLK